MVILVLAMLVVTGCAVAVVGVVAVPARRDGRDVLTAKGEEARRAARERHRRGRHPQAVRLTSRRDRWTGAAEPAGD